TLLIIKPDAFERKLVGNIINRLERAGFDILDIKLVRLTPDKAREFYAVHEGKPFIDKLVDFMSSSPVIPIKLGKDNAVADLRTLIGATNPDEAACGTLRQEIALDVQKNSVHASDSPENAAVELAFFFG
ncbi:MAG TPA: nucleoside-diphosphate kinase, partial [candidate division Zixibacteria bacterium]|nr:nucleoside-diphosphate kinase [candidate division Zixibacteria bacterium]